MATPAKRPDSYSQRGPTELWCESRFSTSGMGHLNDLLGRSAISARRCRLSATAISWQPTLWRSCVKSGRVCKRYNPLRHAPRPRPPTPAVPQSPQSRNLRVGPQLPFDIVTGRPENNPGGAPGLELAETCAQFLARAGEAHLLRIGHVHQRVVAV